MKKISLVFSLLVSAAAATCLLRHETHAVNGITGELRRRAAVAAEESAKFEVELTALRSSVDERKSLRRQLSNRPQLDPKLEDWLLGGNYGRAPESVIPKLLSALELPWNDSTNYLLISKATLHQLEVAWNSRGTNMLGDWVCGLLSITPQERQQIDSACMQTRTEFTSWAKANLQREGPSGERIARYTIPASAEFAQRLTNSFYSAVNRVIGDERGQLLWSYEAHWFKMKLGSFGGVSNVLTIARRPETGQPDLWYSYRPQGHAGPIAQEEMPNTFRNLFPGGWSELAQLEGFELPKSSQEPPD